MKFVSVVFFRVFSCCVPCLVESDLGLFLFGAFSCVSFLVCFSGVFYFALCF